MFMRMSAFAHIKRMADPTQFTDALRFVSRARWRSVKEVQAQMPTATAIGIWGPCRLEQAYVRAREAAPVDRKGKKGKRGEAM